MCTAFDHYLEEYQRGVLDPKTTHTVNQHVQSCHSCHDTVLFIEGLERVGHQAPLYQPPQDLTTRILRRLPPEQSFDHTSGKWWGWWIPVGVTAAAAMAAWVFVWTPGGSRTGVANNTVSSSSPLRPITFTLHLPEAQEVAVVGDFNAWDPHATRLTRHDGSWNVTVQLAPGQYQYMFVVNGATWMPDPHAVQQVDDGYGRKNALLTL